MSDRTLALTFLTLVALITGLISAALGLDLVDALQNAAIAIGVLVGAIAGSCTIGWLLGGFFSSP